VVPVCGLSRAVLVPLVALLLSACADSSELPRLPADRAPRFIASWVDHHTVGRPYPADTLARRTVRLRVFSDYQCPSCASLSRELGQLEAELDGRLVISWGHFPILGHLSDAAAAASECAARQGLSDGFRDYLFTRSREISTRSWVSLAAEAGVEDPAALEQCVRDPEIRRKVRSEVKTARALGVRATPTLLLDSLLFEGSPGSAYLRTYVDIQTADPR